MSFKLVFLLSWLKDRERKKKSPIVRWLKSWVLTHLRQILINSGVR